MKKLLVLSLFLLPSFFCSAQKVFHDANAQVRPVAPFNAIRVSGGIDLFLSYGEEALAVSARDREARDRIRTEVENGVLKIWYEWKDGRGGIWNIARHARAYVSYKTLAQISASGGSDVLVDGTLKTSNLTINVAGGSDFKGRVEVVQLKVDQSGGSDVEISGRAASARIDVSGGSDFRGYDLEAETCRADASGGSNIRVSVSKELKADASGGSDVLYKGNPTTTGINKSGGSNVKKTD